MNVPLAKTPDRPVVLVVDDDPAILSALQRLLHRLEVEVLTADGPMAALALLKQRNVAVLVTDYMMPGMNGIELLILVKEKWPRIKSIMITACSDIQVVADAVNRSLISFFITKPWQNPELVRLVGEALKAHRAASAGVDGGLEEPSQLAPAPLLSQRPDQASPFGKYQLFERIATGGMAELYRAKIFGAGGFEKEVAIKKILPHLSRDEGFVKMFLDEAMIMVTLNHGNIVSVLDFGEAGGEYFLVMEYVRGLDLHQLLYPAAGNTEALPMDAAVYVAQQVCLGLDYAHRKVDAQGQPLNIIHRDIGPKNVLASFEGGVKITDFGIARASHRIAHTTAGMVKGTLTYMSPEQITGGMIDRRCDIYAVGTMLYELLTGIRPFEGATSQESVARITSGVYEKAHAVNPEIPKRLSEIIDKALKLHPSRRYQTAGEMAVNLQSFLHDRGLHPDANYLAELIRARRIQ